MVQSREVPVFVCHKHSDHFRIAYKHIQSAVKTDKCPIAELQKSYSSGDTESNGPNFLLSLVKTEGLGAHDIVGLTTDLFAAGIDSVSNGPIIIYINICSSIKMKWQCGCSASYICLTSVTSQVH